MNGIEETGYILAICAGGEAYKMEFEKLAKETFEKENKKDETKTRRR